MIARMWRLPLVLALLLPSGAVAQPRGVERAARALSAALERAHRLETGPDHRVRTAHEDAGFATVVTASFDPPLYPGTGVATVLVGADGRSYGQHGERDLAALARALGWLRDPPTAAVFLRAINASQFNGMLAHRAPPALELAGGVLGFTVRRADPMSGDEVETVVVEIRERGAATITTSPITTGEAPPSARTILAQAAAGQSVGALELHGALRGVRGAVDAELRGWLAAISVTDSASDAIPSEAIRAIGSSPESANALRARWRSLPPSRRATLLELAASHHGAEFRDRVAR